MKDGTGSRRMLADEVSTAALSPAEARLLFRGGVVTPTAGWCAGYAQANLIIVPKAQAFDFLLFAQRNPKSCPILGVLDAGETSGPLLADGDIRTDLPQYTVYVDGEKVAEPTDISGYWRQDLVTFIVGCSFTFEAALQEGGIPIAHIDQGTNVPMYRTSIWCQPAGSISGPLVVSMRPIPASQVPDAVRITSRYPAVHGAPVHVGNPEELGITDLSRPDFGDPVQIQEGYVPVFWACGVTPQAAVMESRPALAIGHAPGHMLITDARDSSYLV
ncbi:putative hydro-lyase [Arthrobacter gengyunqii]|uniref:Putative hydro-lyase LJ751_17185 n=1 Tax=Arthrobacter gengyunqii TaxID=2886940 RepID=A0A9X1S859_9MICC|nr:putative hydro-lyase [Arthrobacter gengyunqii]MCC3271062.1 putative hydro-lyase [Arthrobacter gengyunqii]UOY96768.1 putative hydro-lyase [Arthrobacter gengyunqii]